MSVSSPTQNPPLLCEDRPAHLLEDVAAHYEVGVGVHVAEDARGQRPPQEPVVGGLTRSLRPPQRCKLGTFLQEGTCRDCLEHFRCSLSLERSVTNVSRTRDESVTHLVGRAVAEEVVEEGRQRRRPRHLQRPHQRANLERLGDVVVVHKQK
eukprot:1124452-Prorocentrum_minimum.AAC.1